MTQLNIPDIPNSVITALRATDGERAEAVAVYRRRRADGDDNITLAGILAGIIAARPSGD